MDEKTHGWLVTRSGFRKSGSGNTCFVRWLIKEVGQRTHDLFVCLCVCFSFFEVMEHAIFLLGRWSRGVIQGVCDCSE